MRDEIADAGCPPTSPRRFAPPYRYVFPPPHGGARVTVPTPKRTVSHTIIKSSTQPHVVHRGDHAASETLVSDSFVAVASGRMRSSVLDELHDRVRCGHTVHAAMTEIHDTVQREVAYTRPVHPNGLWSGALSRLPEPYYRAVRLGADSRRSCLVSGLI